MSFWLCLPQESAVPEQLGPLEITCDAPPYLIVQACHQVGIESPQDVRWCRVSHLLGSVGWQELLRSASGAIVWRIRFPQAMKYCCGLVLPDLEKTTFVLSTQREVSYLLGQCPRCHTVFWEEA